MTFEATYLGSNGWLIKFKKTNLIIDPWLKGDLIFPPGEWFFKGSLEEEISIDKEIDILGFSMGGIICRHWLQKFNGYKRTRRLISIGSPHKGTLMAQLIPKYPFKGISDMKIYSKFLRELADNDFFLDDIECINFFTYWDLMVFPGWWTNLNFGKKISVKVYKHRNLVRYKIVVDKLIDEIIM